ncbi:MULTISPECIES: hypothetical protein [Sphingobium]|jgi:hypothetical protein|uniref:Uncharacterized protein n=2 Tax=Sphingobium TaxID=165695 RepID=A0A5B8CBF7_SPHSA|nr:MULTISPECIES: hypothetical protein [Sphingobium]QDC36569.1 hypothetical protein FIL70_04220 [Sphingobium fuliginis ATCC 27551]QNG43945.1 hypothetical protein H3V42_18775 [Sphingobium yanoikuyae]
MYLMTHRPFSGDIVPFDRPIDVYPHAFEPARLVVAAARCWVTARKEAIATKASLYDLLAPFGCEAMTMSFDKLMALFQECLARPIQLGDAFLSSDEQALVDLINRMEAAGAYTDCLEIKAVALECRRYLRNSKI